MSMTIDCGEGKHDVCRGRGTAHYLIPQLDDGEEFECSCSCHKKAPDMSGEQRLHPESRGGRNYHDESWGG